MAKTATTASERSLSSARLSFGWKALYYFSFFLLTFFYIGLVFIPLPEQSTLQHYNLSVGNFRMLVLPIVVFLVLIWLASFYGSLKIKSYAGLIRSSPDGKAVNTIGNGFMVLALSLPFSSCFSNLVNLISRNHPGARPALTIVNNYIALLLMAAALLLIARGAERLSSLAGQKLIVWPERVWVLAFILFSSLYGYFLVGQTSISLNRKIYYMPHWSVLLTIAIPYLYIWYRGLKGAEEIYQYQKNVRGHLYKSALRYLAAGIALVITSSVITRTLTTASNRLNHLNLTPILAIVYGLLVIMAAGYLMIALGAKKLRQIEEA